MTKPLRIRAKMGRPTRYTVEAASEILSRLAEGESLYRICKDEHLPGEATVRDWVDRHPRFGEAYRRARQHQAHRWFEEVVELADESEGVETVPQLGSYQLRVNARRWAAARLVPEQYGERPPVQQSGRAEVHIYLPGKPSQPGDSALVVEGTAAAIEDVSDGDG